MQRNINKFATGNTFFEQTNNYTYLGIKITITGNCSHRAFAQYKDRFQFKSS